MVKEVKDQGITIMEDLELTDFDYDLKFEESLGTLVFDKATRPMEKEFGTSKKKHHKQSQIVTNKQSVGARVMITTGPLDVEDDN